MKNKLLKVMPIFLGSILMLTGCNKTNDNQGGSSANLSAPVVNNSTDNSESSVTTDSNVESKPESSSESETSTESSVTDQSTAETLEVRFGDGGSPFTLRLYDNSTAAAIKRHVGTADWRLPIYHYDDYENWEVMQYYDIPSRYEIPSNAEAITSEKAGEVYYSEPNRIVLFFGDAEVSGEYSKVGYFDYSEEFRSAVENNPVLEGWGNKLVLIQSN